MLIARESKNDANYIFLISLVLSLSFLIINEILLAAVCMIIAVFKFISWKIVIYYTCKDEKKHPLTRQEIAKVCMFSFSLSIAIFIISALLKYKFVNLDLQQMEQDSDTLSVVQILIEQYYFLIFLFIIAIYVFLITYIKQHIHSEDK